MHNNVDLISETYEDKPVGDWFARCLHSACSESTSYGLAYRK